MLNIPFKQVDVFTNVRFKGNPVAVVLRGDGLTAAQMQQIANWTNLSETTFALTPADSSADYRVRIFTPNAEMPFAGHPTIGTAHALLEAGLIEAKNGSLVQQCGAGLVKLQVTEGENGTRWISFDLPEPKLSPPLDEAQREDLEGMLGCTLDADIPPQVVDVGPRWLVAQLPNAQAVLEVRPDLQRMKETSIAHGFTGVVIFGAYDPGARAGIEVRAFAPAFGANEDPVCGSGNGCVAAFIRSTGQTGRFGNELLASQGAAVGRAGALRLSLNNDGIRVGGNAVTCIDGTLKL